MKIRIENEHSVFFYTRLEPEVRLKADGRLCVLSGLLVLLLSATTNSVPTLGWQMGTARAKDDTDCDQTSTSTSCPLTFNKKLELINFSSSSISQSNVNPNVELTPLLDMISPSKICRFYGEGEGDQLSSHKPKSNEFSRGVQAENIERTNGWWRYRKICSKTSMLFNGILKEGTIPAQTLTKNRVRYTYKDNSCAI